MEPVRRDENHFPRLQAYPDPTVRPVPDVDESFPPPDAVHAFQGIEARLAALITCIKMYVC